MSIAMKKPVQVNILLNKELLSFSGSNKRYIAYKATKKEATPISKKRPVKKILNTSKTEAWVRLKFQINSESLTKKDSARNTIINAYNTAYRSLVTFCLRFLIIHIKFV